MRQMVLVCDDSCNSFSSSPPPPLFPLGFALVSLLFPAVQCNGNSRTLNVLIGIKMNTSLCTWDSLCSGPMHFWIVSAIYDYTLHLYVSAIVSFLPLTVHYINQMVGKLRTRWAANDLQRNKIGGWRVTTRGNEGDLQVIVHIPPITQWALWAVGLTAKNNYRQKQNCSLKDDESIHPSIHPPSTPPAYLGFHWEQAKLGSLDSPLYSHTLKLLLGAPLEFFSQMRCMFNPSCRFRAYCKHSSQPDMSVRFQKEATWRHSDQMAKQLCWFVLMQKTNILTQRTPYIICKPVAGHSLRQIL